MEVAVSQLRAELRNWIAKAREGEDIVVTERGVPVVRISAIGSADLIERLEREGLLTAPAEPAREVAAGHERAQPIRGEGVSGLVRRLRR